MPASTSEATHDGRPVRAPATVRAVTERDCTLLTIPAVPDYVRIARLVVAAMSAQLGFSYDEVEDLRIAVDEACFCLIGEQGHDGSIDITCRLDGDRLQIEVVADKERSEPASETHAHLSQTILKAMVDHVTAQLTGGRPHVRLVKQRAAASA